MNKLKWEDLPPEIQSKMLDHQKKQGNERNPEVFKSYTEHIRIDGRFNWTDTKEGYTFWEIILKDNNIDHFYTVYPKQTISTVKEFKKGDYIKISSVESGTYEVKLEGSLKYGADPSKKDLLVLMPEGFEPDNNNIPEYVECVDITGINNLKKGMIYKVLGEYKSTKSDYQLEGLKSSWMKLRFNPSTKEAYEAQFIKTNESLSEINNFKVGDWVSFYSKLDKKTYTSKIKTWGASSYCVLENEKKPFKHLLRKATAEEIYKANGYPEQKEFILPEKWYCKPDNEKDAFILGKYFDDNKCGCKYSREDLYQTALETVLIDGLSNNNWGFCKKENHTEITFEQFKKYVLKDITPKFVEIKVIERIIYSERTQNEKPSIKIEEPTLYIKPKQNLLYTEDFKTNELDLPTLIKPKKSLLIKL